MSSSLPSRRDAAPLLIDLDGVLRLWDQRVNAEVEQRFGLPGGTIARVAFAPDPLNAAICGAVSDETWRAGMARTLEDSYGAGKGAAIAAWSHDVGHVDPLVRRLVVDERKHRRVVLVTNATSRLRGDLYVLGIIDDLDAIANSSEIGVAKPNPALFAAAAALAAAPLDECVFVDDSASNVEAARSLGMTAHHYRAPGALATFLARHSR